MATKNKSQPKQAAVPGRPQKKFFEGDKERKPVAGDRAPTNEIWQCQSCGVGHGVTRPTQCPNCGSQELTMVEVGA